MQESLQEGEEGESGVRKRSGGEHNKRKAERAEQGAWGGKVREKRNFFLCVGGGGRSLGYWGGSNLKYIEFGHVLVSQSCASYQQHKKLYGICDRIIIYAELCGCIACTNF